MIASNYKYLLIIMLLFTSLFKAHANFSSATSSYVLLNTKKMFTYHFLFEKQTLNNHSKVYMYISSGK